MRNFYISLFFFLILSVSTVLPNCYGDPFESVSISDTIKNDVMDTNQENQEMNYTEFDLSEISEPLKYIADMLNWCFFVQCCLWGSVLYISFMQKG